MTKQCFMNKSFWRIWFCALRDKKVWNPFGSTSVVRMSPGPTLLLSSCHFLPIITPSLPPGISLSSARSGCWGSQAMGRGDPWDEGPALSDSLLWPETPAQGRDAGHSARAKGEWLFLCLLLVLALLMLLATSWHPLLHLFTHDGVGRGRNLFLQFWFLQAQTS